MSERWKPNTTVAAIIEKDGKFLLVEEHTPEGLRLNNPAGHLDEGESLVQACAREALEETMHLFTPTCLVGVYMSRTLRAASATCAAQDITFLRFAFVGSLGKLHDQALDTDILRTVWMTREEIAACREQHRNPLLMKCIDDYLQGQRAPLSLLFTYTATLENLNG